MSRMKLLPRHVEVFQAIMLTQSVTRAAEDLHTSQPTTSRVLAELERLAGFRLFIRDGRRMVPTPEAVMLFEEVQRRFVGMERIAGALKAISSFDGKTLRIASIPSVSFGLLPQAMPAFRARYPQARAAIDVQTFDAVIARVVGGQSDIGFTAYPTERLGLRSKPVLAAEAVCVLPRGHRLLRQKRVRAEDLAGEPFISLEASVQSRQRIDQVFQDRGIARQMVLETQNGATVCGLVKQGAGLSVVDPLSAHAFDDPALGVRPFTPSILFEFNVVWRSDRPLTQLAGAFLDVLATIAAGIPARISRQAHLPVERASRPRR